MVIVNKQFFFLQISTWLLSPRKRGTPTGLAVRSATRSGTRTSKEKDGRREQKEKRYLKTNWKEKRNSDSCDKMSTSNKIIQQKTQNFVNYFLRLKNKPRRTVQKIFAKTVLQTAAVQNSLAKVANRFTACISQRFCLR